MIQFLLYLANIVPVEPGSLPSPVENPVETTACFIHNLAITPFNLVNYIFVGIVNTLLSIVPSTPEAFKIGNIMSAIATEQPLMWKISGEIVGTLTPMLLTLVLVKAWKIFKPF